MCQCISIVNRALHPQRKGFQSLQQQERVERADGRPKIAQAFYPRTDDEAQLLRALLGRRGPASDAAISGRAVLEAARFTITGGRLLDPWERPYAYAYKVPAGGWTNPGFVLYSAGPDGGDNAALLPGGFPEVASPANVDNIHANRN